MATPPKAVTRKPGVKSAPVAAKAPMVQAAPKSPPPVAKIEPKPVPMVSKAKPVVAPKIPAPAAKVVAKPIINTAPKPAPVLSAPKAPAPEKAATPEPIQVEPIQVEPMPVDWPVAAMPAEPAQIPETAPSKPTQKLADATDILPVPTADTTKGKMIMTDMLETAKTYADEAKTRFQSAFGDVSEKAKTAMAKSSKAFEEMGELTKGNLEAVVESSKIAAKGVETMSQEAAEFGRTSFEKTSATMKSFAAIKTPAEFFQLQSDLMSATMDSFASAASKNSEAFLKLASDISAPISNRVSIVSEKMKSLAA